MKFNGAQIICKLLERQGIRILSGIPGGAILPLYDALYDSPLRHVLARHEQGAGFIAQGMARVTGRAAVCLGTSGPGATNLLTAIADAKLDSTPLVAITGQVPSSLLRTDAFQEVDTFGLTLPITKHSFMVMHPEELLEVIPRAFEIAESGRPGPVVVDVPKDIFLGICDVETWPEPGKAQPPQGTPAETVARMAELIAKAQRPVLYIGGGAIGASAGGLVLELAQRIGAPVASTLMGLGAVPCDHPLALGMLGMHGAPFTNYIMDEADLLIAIGARFDDRATGHAPRFCERAGIIHIDIDPCEIDKIKATSVSAAGDAGTILRQLLAVATPQERPEWLSRIACLKASHPLVIPKREQGVHPLEFCKILGDLLPPDAIVSTDVGQHQMWMAQGYPVRQPRTFLTSGGLGTMGFGLPAAIGGALAAPGRRTVCVSGDGSILMNIQELATLAELNLDVTVIILNNNRLGMVRQQQELFYRKRYAASIFERQPDFAAVARAFGIRAYDLTGATNVADALKEAMAQPGPCFINLPIDPEENVYPIVPPGAANTEMLGVSAGITVDPMPSNPAIVPVPNTQKDFYDWTERRQQKLKQVQAGNHDLIFVGDSITHMFEMEGRGRPVWQRSFGNIRTLNLGYGWDCIQNVLWRLENGEFTGQQPKLVVLNIGTNNLTGNDAGRTNTAEEIVAGIEEICHWIHCQSPVSNLLVMSLFPRGLSHEAIHTQVKEVNEALKASLTGKPHILQLDIGQRLLGSDGEIPLEVMDDRCHPTEKGYAIWAEALDPLVKQCC